MGASRLKETLGGIQVEQAAGAIDFKCTLNVFIQGNALIKIDTIVPWE